MKKILLRGIFLISFLIIGIIIYLSTIGYQTSQFNNLIYERIKLLNNNLNLEIKKIKIKLNIRDFTLYLSTKEPNIIFNQVSIPITELKSFIDLKSLIRKNILITKVSININNVDYNDIEKILKISKPSNLKRIALNHFEKGKITGNYELIFDDKFNISNFLAEGYVKNFQAKVNKNLKLENASFLYFVEKNSLDLKNLKGSLNNLLISEGNLNLSSSDEIEIASDFKTSIKLNLKDIKKILPKNKDYLDNKLKNLFINSDLTNEIKLKIDKTRQISDYSFSGIGNVSKTKISLKNPIESNMIKKKIEIIDVDKSKIKIKFNKEKFSTDFDGKYSIDGKNYNVLKFKNILAKGTNNISVDLDFDERLFIDLINYNSSDTTQNVKANILQKENKLLFKQINYLNNDDFINVHNLEFDKTGKINKLEKIELNTKLDKKTNNAFTIEIKKNIEIKGKKFDATKLLSIINKNDGKSIFDKFSKNINITLDEINTGFKDQNIIQKFNLIGKIKNGKFEKLSSKGEFSKNKFLDISLKKNEENTLKIFEIYSDIPDPFIKEYDFFRGVIGGKLTFVSSFDKRSSTNQMIIEKFKIKDAPGFLKLLSLADLKGLADAAKGNGVSFDELQINFTKQKDKIELNELYAIGPSVSILMEGYIDNKSGLVSFKGNMIPAKTLNTIISKIPVVGEIIIPKDIGEGLFGISFKIKGLPGKVKTTVNPLRTITPRFIQKAIKKK